jgi:hypothetical protein
VTRAHGSVTCLAHQRSVKTRPRNTRHDEELADNGVSERDGSRAYRRSLHIWCLRLQAGVICMIKNGSWLGRATAISGAMCRPSGHVQSEGMPASVGSVRSTVCILRCAVQCCVAVSCSAPQPVLRLFSISGTTVASHCSKGTTTNLDLGGGGGVA